MARSIGQVKGFENGMFYVKDVKGEVRQLKAGDMIYEGDQVFGAQTNMAEAKIVIDVLLAGAGDVILAKDGAVTFDAAVLEGVFSRHAGIVSMNSNEEALALASMDESGKGTVEAGDETAAGDVVTDTERMVDTFADRTGAVTDVSTDLRPTSANVAETTIAPTEATLVATPAAAAPGQPEQPEEPEEPETMATIPTLDVVLGEAEISSIQTPLENPGVTYSSIGAGEVYRDGSGNLILDASGNVPSANSEVSYNPGNGYGVETTDEKSAGAKRIDTEGEGREALVLDLDDNVASANIVIKHFKQDQEGARWEAYDSTGKLVGTGSTAFPNTDSTKIITVTPNLVENGSIQYIVFIGSENGYYVQEVESAIAVDYSYSYPLDIIDASLGLGASAGETLGDVIVTGLPEGAVLSNAIYGDITVPVSGEVQFGSDTEIANWTLTTPEELPENSSIVASLTSTDLEGNSATAYVGVYGDNVIAGSEGPDSLEGRDGDDILSGGDGDDFLSGGAGSDSLYGEEGDDTLVFDSGDDIIDGGLGTDTLVLAGTTDIDFEAWNSDSLKNVEIIDLTSGDHELSNLSLNDVINMTDSSNDIYILGDSLDKVDFLDANGWELSATPVIETINGASHTFDVYINADDPTVMVKVEQAITDTI